jgi:hypothetical protein
MEKTVWTLVRPSGAEAEGYEAFLLHDLPSTVSELLPSTEEISVTFQDRSAYRGTTVNASGRERTVDAVVEITTAGAHLPIEDLHDFLLGTSDHVQGWRVHPTTIFDALAPRGRGEPAPFPNLLIFVQRLDGTTPEHFSRNWYIHGGHLDGEELENERTLQERRAREEAGVGRRYVQNRVLEPLTPTAWVVDGYTQLHFPMFVPEIGEKNPRRPEEAPFERWPPRILQGREHRVL